MTTLKISPTIRREIAQAIVAQSHPGYMSDYMGEKFAVDTDGDGTLDTVMHRDANAPWNPWNDDAEAISVAALYEDSVCTFDPTPDEDDGIEPDASRHLWKRTAAFSLMSPLETHASVSFVWRRSESSWTHTSASICAAGPPGRNAAARQRAPSLLSEAYAEPAQSLAMTWHGRIWGRLRNSDVTASAAAASLSSRRRRSSASAGAGPTRCARASPSERGGVSSGERGAGPAEVRARVVVGTGRRVIGGKGRGPRRGARARAEANERLGERERGRERAKEREEGGRGSWGAPGASPSADGVP